MGLITAAGKVGAKKDILVENTKEKIDSAKDWAKQKRDNAKEFIVDPSAYMGVRYNAAKEKALEEERNKPQNNGPGPLKKVGLGAAAAAGAVGGAIVGGVKKAGNAIKDAGSGGSNSGGGSSGGTDTGLTFLFLIALFSHLLDAITKFQRPGFMIYVYIGIIVYTFFFLFKGQIGNSDEKKLLAVIVLAYVLPYLPDIFPDNKFALTVAGLLFLFPLLPVYIGTQFPDQALISKATKGYMVVWVIILAFYLIATFAPDMNTKTLVKNPMAGVNYVFAGVSKTLDKVAGSFNNAFARAVAQATGQPYEGEEESRVGIYVEDVRPVESKYNLNSNVYVEARIQAINVKDRINVNTICYIEDMKQGVVNPTMLYDVTGEYDNIVTCNLGPLPEGNYEVKVRANFEFESSSDIEYTFVNNRIKSDQYSKLGINPTTIATYTGGPVELGLPSLTQPLRVTVDPKIDSQLSSYPFGVSLKNKWQQGKVVRGIRYSLDTPVEVTLTDCSRDPVSKAEPDTQTGRNLYIFAMNTTNAQDVFDGITCRMRFAKVGDLLGTDLKNIKTFAARARYEYAVEGSTMVIVEKS